MTGKQNDQHELVVHPAHGVGRLTGQEKLSVSGTELDVSVISFVRNNLTLRIPTARLIQDGVRPLASKEVIEQALRKLGTPSRLRYAEQYRQIPLLEERLNTGDLVAIATVVRDLHRSDSARETPFSVENTFRLAVSRLSEEMALVLGITEDEAHAQILGRLSGHRPPA